MSLKVGWQRMTMKLGVKFIIFHLNVVDMLINLSRHAESAPHIDILNSVNVEIDNSVEEIVADSDEIKRIEI